MSWLSRFFAKVPEPEIAWHKERTMGRWDREAWAWRHEEGQPYKLVSCHANKAHAEEEARYDKLNIDCVDSRVIGPYYHKAGTCECWRGRSANTTASHPDRAV